MKIWYILMIFPAETFAASDIRELRRLGGKVSVHALRGPRPGWEQILQEGHLSGVEVTHGGAKTIIPGLRTVLARPGLSLILIGWLLRQCFARPVDMVKSFALIPRAMDLLARAEKEKPEVIHLFWGHYPSILGYLVKKKCPTTVLSIFLGAYDLFFRDFPGTREVAAGADLVFTHAHANVPAITRMGVPEARIQVIYRGIDLERIRSAERSRVGRRILTVGRLISVKRIDAALAVFQSVRKTWSDATMVVLGDGPERTRLETMADAWGLKGAVQFRGHVPQSEVFAEMAVSEVFLLLSDAPSERLPNVAKEAMAAGCACVVTNTAGISELITDGISGFIVPTGAAPGEVASVISRIFNDPGMRLRFHARALEHLREHFDLRASMQEYLLQWSAAAEGKGGEAPPSKRPEVAGSPASRKGHDNAHSLPSSIFRSP
jgi:glycosyltransferase involved in cell wall biosynthesis